MAGAKEAATMPEVNKDPKTDVLPPFFPLVRTGCENVSDEFFQCLQSNLPPGDLVARDQALQECAVKQVAYEQCFRASLENKTLAAPRVWVDFKPQDDTEKFDCLKFHN
eukprot:GHVT01101648.1.p3 GENE.GHVT01101648.1~~GHVT01101648.1.p3  ORF type:complete len:109 (+),score=15.29 GHVT01101648.1:1937-2263(+)